MRDRGLRLFRDPGGVFIADALDPGRSLTILLGHRWPGVEAALAAHLGQEGRGDA